MITLKRLNVVKKVASEEQAAKLVTAGFERIGGEAEGGVLESLRADLEQMKKDLKKAVKGNQKQGEEKEEKSGDGADHQDRGGGQK